MMAVENKTVLVTGAATGIGAAIADGFAYAGAQAIGIDIEPETQDKATTRFDIVQCDVTDRSAMQHCVADVESRYGDIDVLVNNAALASSIMPKPFEDITSEEWTRVMTVNTLAPFICAQVVAPGMRKRRSGRIINMTSAVVFQAVPYNLHYFSSKGAIATMTRSLARELGDDGITVNGIAPGMTVTEGISDNAGYSAEMLAHIVNARCIAREERPEDMVGVCLFLASDQAEFVTGQILTVDGGLAFH